MQLEELTGDERTLVVVALQALFRERLSASNAVLRYVAGKSSRRLIFLGCVKEDALKRMQLLLLTARTDKNGRGHSSLPSDTLSGD
jgi:hypothetical protein